MIITSRQEKQLFRLTEYENARKLETLLKKNAFDIAYRFSVNQNYEPSLLAEISLCNANHNYNKKDF